MYMYVFKILSYYLHKNLDFGFFGRILRSARSEPHLACLECFQTHGESCPLLGDSAPFWAGADRHPRIVFTNILGIPFVPLESESMDPLFSFSLI